MNRDMRHNIIIMICNIHKIRHYGLQDNIYKYMHDKQPSFIYNMKLIGKTKTKKQRSYKKTIDNRE